MEERYDAFPFFFLSLFLFSFFLYRWWLRSYAVDRIRLDFSFSKLKKPLFLFKNYFGVDFL